MFKDTKAFSSFSVDDIYAAKKFYSETLGIEVEEISEGLMLHIAGGNPTFVYPKKDHVPATYTILNFPIEDIDKAVDALSAKGVIFEQYDNMTDEKGIARGIAAKRGPDVAWFKDPAGNVISVIKEP